MCQLDLFEANNKKSLNLFPNCYYLVFAITLSFMVSALQSCASLDTQKKGEGKSNALQAQKALIYNYLESGEAVKANAELAIALNKYPEEAELHMLMGLTQMALKNPILAISYLEKSYNMMPSPSAALNLSSAQIEARQFPQARKTLKGALKNLAAGDKTKYRFPERIFHNIGLTYEKEKKLKLAEKYYQKALVQNSLFYLSLMRMGRVYQKTGRNKLAEDVFKKAIHNCNKCLEPVAVLSKHYLKMGKKKEATQILKGYLAQKDLQVGDRSLATNILTKINR